MLTSPLAELTPYQCFQLFKLRVDIFVVEQQCAYEEIDEVDALASTRHVLAFDGPSLAGAARVFPDAEGHTWHIGRLCVAPPYRGSGLATQIMQTCLALCEGPAVLTAQSPLVDYYAAFGFQPSGPEFDWDGIPHTPMRLREGSERV
ncbi:GNAT family N-acetyltransferase [Corynebacterium sp. H128]|uniref:GNAT family N-acetyltransferase n=1 Tax=Corynebacterium sp. H128 TaxID=3133427 RepID=UPI0030B5A17E